MINLGLKVGDWLNSYIKSYGSPWFEWGSPANRHYFEPRHWLVMFFCAIISRIDEAEYQRQRNTTRFQKGWGKS